MKRMDKDKVFADKKNRVDPFEFNEQVAGVFDDMLNRSVPLYKECILRQSQMTRDFYQPGTRIYDLGCSHGNIGVQILTQFKDIPFTMVGIDNSMPMIEKYTRRKELSLADKRIQLICSRIEDVQIANASVVLINLTLQFLDQHKRDRLIQRIFNGMKPGGILLLTEKTVQTHPVLESLEQKYYRTFKLENGYSELEISQKRDALEKVLVPDTIETHLTRLKTSGFETVDVWLKWFNFTSILAVK